MALEHPRTCHMHSTLPCSAPLPAPTHLIRWYSVACCCSVDPPPPPLTEGEGGGWMVGRLTPWAAYMDLRVGRCWGRMAVMPAAMRAS